MIKRLRKLAIDDRIRRPYVIGPDSDLLHNVSLIAVFKSPMAIQLMH